MDLGQPVTAHLNREVKPLRADQAIGDALASLRGAILPERIVYFYVEDASGRLTGVVPTRRLLGAALDATVGSCMIDRVVSLPDTATLGDASEVFLSHRLLALPVVDGQGRLLGTIDISTFSDDLVAGRGHQAIDDVFQTIGVHVAKANQPGAWGSFRDRFPWLLANIAGGTACALLISRFERFLDLALVLALFMPVVLALAESVSIQSMTLTLQALHAGVPRPRALLASLLRELATALLLGLAAGAVVALVVLLWRGDRPASVVIGATIAASMVTACLLGVALPTAVRATRLDPKLAAGPITLALTDVAALLFYFSIGVRLLG